MENIQPVVNNEEEMTTPPVSEDVNTQLPEEIISEEVIPETPATQAGDRTKPNLLLQSLQDERAKNALLEAELEELKTSSALSEEEVFSDEGKVLQGEIRGLKLKISEIESNLTKERLISSNPIFKEKWQEFEEFRSHPDNKGMNLRTAAKAYLAENGLLEPARKGLEKPTGGTRIPLASGMTAEDVKTLRETNFKKYQEMVIKGQIKIES